jgi:hypothetical protein
LVTANVVLDVNALLDDTTSGKFEDVIMSHSIQAVLVLYYCTNTGCGLILTDNVIQLAKSWSAATLPREGARATLLRILPPLVHNKSPRVDVTTLNHREH